MSEENVWITKKNKWITKKEIQTMVSEWFDSMDREKTGKLNKLNIKIKNSNLKKNNKRGIF